MSVKIDLAGVSRLILSLTSLSEESQHGVFSRFQLHFLHFPKISGLKFSCLIPTIGRRRAVIKKFLSAISIPIFLSGCVSAQWVTREYQPYKAGVVKYLDAGADGIIESRREDAIAKMSSYCGSEGYNILKESHDSSWDVYQINPNGYNDGYTATKASSSYLHIYFRCGELSH